jgi:hypothetical protein
LKTTNLSVEDGADTLRTGLKGNSSVGIRKLLLGGPVPKKKRVKFSAGCGLEISGCGYLLWYHVSIFNCLHIYNNNYFTNIKSIFKVDCKVQGA